METEIKPLKLSLGSRDRIIPGFENMDIDAHPGVTHVGDVADLSRFASDSVAEIYASNILEHFPHRDTVKVLKEWRRVLVPGGKLYLSVPDFARAVQIYTQTGLADWIQNFLMGDQFYKTAFHYAIFDEARLLNLVKAAGFSDLDIVDFFDFAPQGDCSNLRSNIDMGAVCLNAIATK